VEVRTVTKAVEPGEAGAALAEIRRRQGEVMEGTLVPAWYWWAVAVPMIGLGIVVDAHEPVAIASAAIVFGVGVAMLTGWVIVGGVRHVKVNEALLGPRGAGLIVGFVGLLVGGTLALAFALQATSVRYPATISTIACAVALVVGGPALMRTLRDIMMGRRTGAG
jgi:hypothetical protein